MRMHIGVAMAMVMVLSSCTSLPRLSNKRVTMDYYAGTRDTITLPAKTTARLEAFFATLPRAKYPESEFTQGLWDKPGLPESLRPKPPIAQSGSNVAPPTKPAKAKKYTVLDERRLVAAISIYDAPGDKWMSSSYLILEEGVRVFPEMSTKHYVLELDQRSLAELRHILDSALEKPNRPPEPMPLKRHGSP